METQIITLTFDQAEELFYSEGGDGKDIHPMDAAIAKVQEALGVTADTQFVWHLPDVFAIRYGSCYVGTATLGDRSIRFVTDVGNWLEGDDKWDDKWDYN